MLEESNSSIFEYLRDRTSSPLFGAFFVSWIIWNYKCVLVLFSYTPYIEKIEYIETVLYINIYWNFVYLFIGPLGTSLAFLFVYPYPAAKVFEFWRKKQKELRDTRLKIDNESLMTLEQSKQIRRRMIEMRTDYENQIRKNDEELEELKRSLVNSQKELEETLEKLKIAESPKFSADAEIVTASESQILNALNSNPYRLFFNPKKGKFGSKTMLFGPGGEILEGSNANESTWRIANGKLELLQSNGLIHSRFQFDVPTKVFTHTNDSDTKSTRGQFMVPEPDAA